MSKKLTQYSIKMFTKELDETFEDKFYIDPDDNYLNVLKQFLNILERYNLEITPKQLDVIIINSGNPNEQRVLLERVVMWLLSEPMEFIFEITPKDGKAFRKVVFAADFQRAFDFISDHYDISEFKKLNIEEVKL